MRVAKRLQNYFCIIFLKADDWSCMFLEIIKNLDWTKIIIAALSLISAGFCIKHYAFKQHQKSGNNSINYQANGDINIGSTKHD